MPLAAVCAIFLYISYLLPVAAGLLVYRRSWNQMGPFDLKGWYPPIAVICVLGCFVLIYIGVQPPNDQALSVLKGAIVTGLFVWFGLERKRFVGPPIGEAIAKRQVEIANAEHEVGESV